LTPITAHSRNPPATELEALIRRYGQMIKRVVSDVGGAAAALDRDDIEQAVIVGIWRQLEREQVIEYPASYIYKAAVRETLRVVRAHLDRQTASLDDVGNAFELAAPGPDPHAALEQRERAALVERSLSQLRDDRQRAVRAHLAGFSTSDVMNMYGWSYQKARNLIARGMADLRRRLTASGIRR
jgi:RNA polymerase sigma factor (sigma-70 family)